MDRCINISEVKLFEQRNIANIFRDQTICRPENDGKTMYITVHNIFQQNSIFRLVVLHLPRHKTQKMQSISMAESNSQMGMKNKKKKRDTANENYEPLNNSPEPKIKFFQPACFTAHIMLINNVRVIIIVVCPSIPLPLPHFHLPIPHLVSKSFSGYTAWLALPGSMEIFIYNSYRRRSAIFKCMFAK